MTSNRLRFPLSLLVLSLGLALGCDQGNVDPQGGNAADAPDPSDYPAPTFKLTPETKGALFTWVDESGSFQLAEAVDGIPADRRNTVRVVVEGHAPGGGDYVYVADLSRGVADAQLRAISRSEWENLGKSARDKKVAALSPPPASPDASPQALGVDAIVYGADWCKPCHLAEDYLKKKGAKVVKKDIEEDPSAGQEMRGKLQRAGMSGSSIPVLDVGGTILRGFSAGAIDAALIRAKAQ
jgi:glutaredoxin